ncbi:hypothetical protein BOS5A_10025 [Bosea sp. EC-HK365B]|nr:hypothetical protein BOSE21B_11044 [Bosea sp. 21B]CAD5261365.1 hypothetical protein BOSE7B_150091 [Bosea sp. 7B]VVT43438.1 hypothetical protein BOS5A_10025 [Bosea sp. EC-HK365B]VXB26982.1 hypothetical protein BOSE29B_10810 [Bosea sp. 29B]VXC30702.1 hypothetical protein BOSE127_180093 [Bosea sp. 127]VXC59597.1 hypothetical protein BOSE125_30273 [Bosea sp. 125]
MKEAPEVTGGARRGQVRDILEPCRRASNLLSVRRPIRAGYWPSVVFDEALRERKKRPRIKRRAMAFR